MEEVNKGSTCLIRSSITFWVAVAVNTRTRSTSTFLLEELRTVMRSRGDIDRKKVHHYFAKVAIFK